MITTCLTQLTGILQQLVFILIGFFGMGFLIGFHELGHFLFAKLFNIRVPSFSLGFGPRLISRKIGETDFCLSAIPFGGYVEIAGAAEVGQGDQKEALATDKRSFAVKPFYQQLLVLLGGIFFNLLFAYCAMILLFVTGIPKTPLMPTSIIANIQQKSSAEEGGLQVGDKILALNDTNVTNDPQKIQTVLTALARIPAQVTIERNGEKITKTIMIGAKETDTSTVGSLGIELDFAETPPHSLMEAVNQGISACNHWIKKTFEGFTHLFSKKGVNNVAGPIMIIAMTVKGAAAGWQIFILLLIIISINLAVLNLIPLPILDGGQILFYSIEALIGRPIPHKVREYIHIGTWIMFMILFAYLSVKDLTSIISPYIDPVLKFLHIR